MPSYPKSYDDNYRSTFEREPASGHLLAVGVTLALLFVVGVALIIRGLL